MLEILKYLFYAAVLFMTVLGFSDVIRALTSALLAVPDSFQEDDELRVVLRNADSAEMQLRNILAKIKLEGYRGKISVVARDEESRLIAGKFLLKYPNIGLFSEADLNYNI